MLFAKKKINYMTLVFLYFKAAPIAVTYKILMTFVNALTPTLTIFITAMFIDSALATVVDRSQLNRVYLPLILLIVLSLYDYLTGVIGNLANVRAMNKLRVMLVLAFADKKAKLKFKYYENQESLDLIKRAEFDEQSVAEFFDTISNTIHSIALIGGFMIVLGMQLWWTPIVFAVASAPSFVVSYLFGKKQYDNEKELTKINRMVAYFSDILTGRDSVEERYVYGYSEKINEAFKNNYEKAHTMSFSLQKEFWIKNRLMSILPFISGSVVIAVLIPAAIFPHSSGETTLSIGMFAALINAILTVSEQLHWRISGMIRDFKYKFEFLKDLNAFNQFEEDEHADCLPATNRPHLDKIEFKNVSFQYPDTDAYILKDFNLELNASKHYAIVGINGAGKTTLTKILTKLYDNYEGEILINDRNLHDYSQAEIKSLFSVVYQDFSHYPVDFYHNIAVGNILKVEDRKCVENAVNVIGLADVVKNLPRKYETPITKVKEDGIDLSGGQWQRIALARMIINPAPLKILDEPTSALDPVSESLIYKQFSEIIDHNKLNQRQGITLFISHRLGSTKLADEIIVISRGKVAEHGTFDELMQKSNLFKQMFESQAHWYTKHVSIPSTLDRDSRLSLIGEEETYAT